MFPYLRLFHDVIFLRHILGVATPKSIKQLLTFPIPQMDHIAQPPPTQIPAISRAVSPVSDTLYHSSALTTLQNRNTDFLSQC